jgi:uncharacterized protein (TIRG00374 family)
MPAARSIHRVAAVTPGRRLVVRGLAGLVAGVACAVAVGWYTGAKPPEVARYLESVPAWAVLACAASSLVVLTLQALRWYSVMGPLIGLSYVNAWQAQVVGQMFNALIPARGGDLLRVQYLGRRTGRSRATILGTEIVDRWLDWWGWIPCILVVALAGDLPRWVFTSVAIFGGVLLGWAATMVVLSRRGYVPRPGSRLGAVVRSLQRGIEVFGTRRTAFIAFAIAPLPWLWEALVLDQVSRGFGIDINLAQSFCLLIGFNLAMLVPSPGAVGTVEAGGTAALVFFGIDQSRALAFMFVYHFCQLLPGIIAGITILIAQGEHLFGQLPVAPAPASASDPP